MKSKNIPFNSLVEMMYNLSLDEKTTLLALLEKNIIESRRDEIFKKYKMAQKEEKSGKLEFSSDMKAMEELLFIDSISQGLADSVKGKVISTLQLKKNLKKRS